MSFFKWLSDKVNHPKARITLRLQKNEWYVGEQLRGEVEFLSEEEFDVNYVVLWLICDESIKKTRTVANQYRSRQEAYWDNGQIFRTSFTLFGVARIPNGYSAKLPIALSIPNVARETYYGVDHNVKWRVFVAADVRNRPSIQTGNHEVIIAKKPIDQTPQPTATKEIIREVVLIPCSYCSSLMPQTAIFCPNCGARRKT